MDITENYCQVARPRLVFATDNLRVEGMSYPGFPLLLDATGEPMEPGQSFLWNLLVEEGPYDVETWEVYGKAMFDFSAYLSENRIPWDRAPMAGVPSALPAYRSWAKSLLQPSTFNLRVRLIHRMYKWAIRQGHIDGLPYRLREAYESPIGDDGSSQPYPSGKTNLSASEWKHELKFLSEGEIAECKADLSNRTHCLMFRLMQQTGLRQCECRSFPFSYVFDPKSRRAEYSERSRIRVNLNPRQMVIKYDKERSIDIPQDLMSDLWWYRAIFRSQRLAEGLPEPTALFLTEAGKPYSASGIQDIFQRLSKRMGFPVRAHMLRHSYAVHTLRRLRRSKTFEGDPLLYLRDRLGHASVETTMVYLRALIQLDASLALEHEELVDRRAASLTPG